MRQGSFQDAHKFTAQWEGGLSDHPADRGGLTAYGASIEFVKDIASSASGKNFLQALNVILPITRESIQKLTRAQVESMFRREFWDALRLDTLPYRQAALLYDAAVNTGRKQAVKLSQRGYNKLTTYGTPLVVDGIMGPKTLSALKADTDVLVKSIIQCRRAFYESLVAQRSSQEVFLNGWINRVNALERYLLGPKS